MNLGSQSCPASSRHSRISSITCRQKEFRSVARHSRCSPCYRMPAPMRPLLAALERSGGSATSPAQVAPMQLVTAPALMFIPLHGHQAFPIDYDQALRQAQEAVKAAVADGHKVLEVDFPVGALTGVQGDGEGQTEMNACMKYLRQFMNAWRQEAATTRIFFPDNQELAIALSGQTLDPGAGRAALDPQFADSRFQMGYLTRQNAAWALLGVNLDKWSPVQLVKDQDTLLVVAYPFFNPKEELGATLEIYEKKARAAGIPIVIFNGALDQTRGGYYPPLFFPELARISSQLLPAVTSAYYIHNFKGSRPGALFRCYPGPWQVMRRNPTNPEGGMRVIWSSMDRPSLKEVSLEILASNL